MYNIMKFVEFYKIIMLSENSLITNPPFRTSYHAKPSVRFKAASGTGFISLKLDPPRLETQSPWGAPVPRV